MDNIRKPISIEELHQRLATDSERQIKDCIIDSPCRLESCDNTKFINIELKYYRKPYNYMEDLMYWREIGLLKSSIHSIDFWHQCFTNLNIQSSSIELSNFHHISILTL